MNSWYRRFLFEGKSNYHIYIGEGYSGYVEPHKHDFYQCSYVLQGKIMEIQYDHETLLKSGECFFTPPGVSHSLYIYEDTRYFCLSFSQNIADILFSHITELRRDFRNLSGAVAVPEEMQSRLEHCLTSLMEEQNYAAAPSYEAAPFLAVAALLIMIRNEFPVQKASEVEQTDRVKAEILQVVRHIHVNYDHALTAEGLSRLTTLSQSAFIKAFQQYTGKSVKQYVTYIRIKEARRLIGLGEMQLQQIAKKVGYQDFSTFFRNFVQLVGASPAEYRRAMHSAEKKEKIVIKGQ